MTPHDVTPQALVAEALAARKLAYAPYSRFAVGAALLCGDGTIVRGCNVENVSYGLTVCAERAAFFAAIALGQREFVALALATGPGATPCGACRQVAREFAADMQVHIADEHGAFRSTTLAALLPESFGAGVLGQGHVPRDSGVT
jgi:cytidine deaminase